MPIFPECLDSIQLMLLLKQEVVELFGEAALRELSSPKSPMSTYAYLVNDHIIFYPGSDFDLSNRPDKPRNPFHLQEVIKLFKEEQQKDETIKAKTLYFPITEERGGRAHFVFVKLDLEQITSHLVDSKAPAGFNLFYFFGPRIWNYSTVPIEQIIQAHFQMPMQSEYREYQAFFDMNTCGYHVCASIILSLQGQDCTEEAVRIKVKELQEKGLPELEEKINISSASCADGWEMLDIVETPAVTQVDEEGWIQVDESGNEIEGECSAPVSSLRAV